MGCNESQISCQLDRIADAMSGFDTNGFLATLIATLVGATIAGTVSVALYRREATSRRRSEIDTATVTLIRAIQEHSDAFRHWQVEYQAFSVNAFQSIGTPSQTLAPPLPPDRASIDTAVEALVLLTVKSERKVADSTRQILYELAFLEKADQRTNEFAAVRRVLVAWRAKRRTDEETLASLATVEARRKTIERGIPETEWPPVPEPYERSPSQP